METIKIKGVKCDDYYFITARKPGNEYYAIDFRLYYANGNICAEKTYHPDWYKVPVIPMIIQEKQGQSNINYRFELIDKELQSDKIPAELPYTRNDYDNNHFPVEYKMYYSLYKAESDSQPDILVDVPFEYLQLMEVSDLKDAVDLPWDIKDKKEYSEKLVKLSQKDIQYQLLDKIVFPEIVLPSRPCSLTSHESYEVVRQYIKQNINPMAASITSDYDCCFTVKKNIKMRDIKEFTVDVNNSWFQFKGQRRKKPKYEKRYNTSRQVECFQMTYSPKNYEQYTPIKGFIGNNQEDLKNNITDYLRSLIEWINEPLEDCPHCKGMGIIIKEKGSD